MDKLTLDDFAVFTEIASAQTLSKVARQRDVAVSFVSRALSRIEAQCGLLLVHRTTHGLALSDDGEVFLEHAHRMLSERNLLTDSIGSRKRTIHGNVRISISELFAEFCLIPKLAELRILHPSLKVIVQIDDGLINLSHEPIDIIVRSGIPPQPEYVIRNLGRHGRALYASPSYLKKFGTPRIPSDLKRHSIITNTLVHSHNQWSFSENAQAYALNMEGHISLNSSAAVVCAALNGAGIARLNDVIAGSLVKEGRLKSVLDKYNKREDFPVYAAILSERHRAPKIRAVIAFLETCFAAFQLKT
jgi:DNA-binding transcriptional LysR family regulator